MNSADPHSPELNDFSGGLHADAGYSNLPPRRRRSSGLWFWVLGGVLLAGAPLGYFLYQYLNDPFRTLPDFPASTYFQDYKSVTGGHYAMEVSVDAELGSKDGIGRLLLFRIKGQDAVVPTLIPDKFSNISFSKNQNYHVSVYVNDQGVIYADACAKQ